MGHIDWETTGAIGLGILIAASAASLGVWKTKVERKAISEAAAAEMAAPPMRRAQPRPGDDRRLRARPQGAGGQLPSLPPGHPPVNMPAPGAPARPAQPARP